MAFSYVVSRVLDSYPHLDPKRVQARLAYASFASLKDRFVYVEVPKAACTAMKVLLRDLYASPPLKLFPRFRRETDRAMFVHARENAPLPPLTALADQDQRELFEAPDVLRFTIVRNPYTRLVSAWRGKVLLCEPSVEDVYATVRGAPPAMGRKHPVGFAEFVAHVEGRIDEVWDAHWRRQVDLTFPKGLAFTHVGKTEDLDATLRILGRQLKCREAITIPRVNECVVKPAAQYSQELARRVYALYEEDFTVFGYDMESWPHDEKDSPGVVSYDSFIDEVIERNVILAHLYGERDRVKRDYDAAYRFSLARLRDTLLRLAG
jgi:Sulfotransferase family